MQRLVAIIALALGLSLSLGEVAMAGKPDTTRTAPYASRSMSWTDLSAMIPATKLDEYARVDYLSFATSRGEQWLVGNKNQLFLTNGKTAKDLTPDLKSFGFASIRQVAGDGQAWLIVGDSGFWESQPDLAYLYDGLYWKNVNYLMANMPPEEWIGTIVGKRGLWVIPTTHGVYQWDTALTRPAAVAYPKAFSELGASNVNFHAVADGWLAEYSKPNAQKSHAFGSPIFDRRFFFFDGTAFKEITERFRGLGDRSVVGSDGSRVLAFGVARTLPKTASIQALVSDGKSTNDVGEKLRRLWDIRETRPLLAKGRVVWTGKGWLITDENNNVAVCDAVACRTQTKSRDVILGSGYGKNGHALLVGYARGDNGGLSPRLALVTTK